MTFIQRVQHWVNWRKNEAELSEEIEAHRLMIEQNLLHDGMTQQEAEQASRRTVGNVLLAREESRDVWLWPWLAAAWRDLRYALRMLRRQPVFAIVVVTMLALGIGTSTVVFSVVNGLLLRPLAATHPEQLASIVVVRQDNQGQYGDLSWPNYVDLRDQNASFSGIAGHALTWVAFGATDKPDLVYGEFVTGNYFDVLGVKPALGREFTSEEGRVPGDAPVVVLSHSLWQRMFAANPAIVGRIVHMNGHAFTVIGIAPEGFTGTKFPLAVDFWTPVAMRATLAADRTWIDARGSGFLAVTGRLKTGVRIEQAQADFDRIGRNLAEAYPNTSQGARVRVVPEVEGRLGGGYRAAILFGVFVLSLACLVLLITCANVANLLLGRSLARTREMGIRMAIGAGRGAIVRQLFVESVLLACVGGVLGMALTYAGTNLVRSLIPTVPPAVQDFQFSPDSRVFLWALAISVLTGFTFGLAPALRAARTDLISATKADGGAAANRAKRAWARVRATDLLVAAQICVSVVVLACAGLLMRSLRQAQTIDPGFRPEGLISMMVSPGLLRYTVAEETTFYKELERRVALLPGVRAASVSGSLLLTTGARSAGPVVREGEAPPLPNRGMSASYLSVGPGYFTVAGTDLTSGRAFTERDVLASTPVAIVNQELARRLFGGEAAAIGKRFRLGPPTSPLLEITGIARDGKYGSLYEGPQPAVFLPIRQRTDASELSTAFLVARSETADLATLADAMRLEVAKLDARVPVTTVRLGKDHVSVPLLVPRIATALTAAFGVLALALATSGVYSVMSHSVSRRTRELGIRMAIGARPNDVLGLTIKQGMSVVLTSLFVGLLLTIAVTRVLQGILLGVSPTDPVTLAGVITVLTATALMACYLPARRAARVDPMRALRAE